MTDGNGRGSAAVPLSGRVASLDEYRGYAVAAMLLVNFLSGYAAVPAVLKHHNTYCSYADTVMPQFFFAVGFAFRLTYLRRAASAGRWATSRSVARRCLGLALLGVVLYHLDGGVKTWDELRGLGVQGVLASAFRRSPFQTLTHIALATLWVLPVVGSGRATRWAYLAASGLLHLGLSAWFYFRHAWDLPVIDGGPLGFLTWSIPLLAGTLAYDEVVARPSRAWARILTAGGVLMLAGHGLASLGGPGPAPLPFLDPGTAPVTLWTMSQRTGSLSYQVFAAGAAAAVYALFRLACDRPGRAAASGLFLTFGRNALAAYVLHSIVAGAVKPYVPKDAPGWYVAAGFALYFWVCYAFVRGLEKSGVYFRL